MKPRQPAHREWWEVSGQQLAEAAGVDVRTVQNCVTEGMPTLGRNRYDLRQAVPWYVKREADHARGARELNDLDVARRRKLEAEAKRAEHELAIAEGAVIPTELHARRLEERLETVAGAVKAIHRYQPEIKAAVTDEAADALCDRMADEILAELHGLSDTIPDAPEEQQR